uniref:Uncharacterized protein n=1 Tax=Knipowitschia caucasica TaxID=637954 RepID=A0AAV2LLP9_KNICA
MNHPVFPIEPCDASCPPAPSSPPQSFFIPANNLIWTTSPFPVHPDQDPGGGVRLEAAGDELRAQDLQEPAPAKSKEREGEAGVGLEPVAVC